MNRPNDSMSIPSKPIMNIARIGCPCYSFLIPANSSRCPICDLDLHLRDAPRTKPTSVSPGKALNHTTNRLLGVGCYISGRENVLNSVAVAITENGIKDLEILCANAVHEKDICNYIHVLIDSILVHYSDFRIAFNVNNFDAPNNGFIKLFESISIALINRFSFTRSVMHQKKHNRLIVENHYFKKGERLDECLASVINADSLMRNELEGNRYAAICAVKAIQMSF
jgi:hypothetical protein